MSIFTNFAHWITGATAKIKQALGFGHDVANWLKNLSDNGTLDIIVAVTPWKLDDALLPVFKEWLAELVKDLNIVDKALPSVDATINAANARINEMGSDAKAITLTGLAAASATWKAEQDGVNLPIQDALAAVPGVYKDVAVLS